MCSILIFAKPDNDHPDPSHDWQKFKRGDVVDVRDQDDFFWGDDVQGPNALGWWRVVVIPSAPASALQSLTTSDRPSDPPTPHRLRVNRVNLDALERGKKLKNADSVSMSSASLLALRIAVPPISNPNVFGASRREIG